MPNCVKRFLHCGLSHAVCVKWFKNFKEKEHWPFRKPPLYLQSFWMACVEARRGYKQFTNLNEREGIDEEIRFEQTWIHVGERLDNFSSSRLMLTLPTGKSNVKGILHHDILTVSIWVYPKTKIIQCSHISPLNIQYFLIQTEHKTFFYL